MASTSASTPRKSYFSSFSRPTMPKVLDYKPHLPTFISKPFTKKTNSSTLPTASGDRVEMQTPNVAQATETVAKKKANPALRAVKLAARHPFQTLLYSATVILPTLDIMRNKNCENDKIPFSEGKPVAVIQGGKWLPWSYLFTDGKIKGSSVHCPVWLTESGKVVGGYGDFAKTLVRTDLHGHENTHYKGTIDQSGNSFTKGDHPLGFVRPRESNGDFRIYNNGASFETEFVSPDGKVRGWPARPSKATYGYKALGNTGPERAQIMPLQGMNLTSGMTFKDVKAMWEAIPDAKKPLVKDKFIAALAHRF